MIDDIARHLHVHRSIAYRIVRTLEEHSFVRRDADGRCLPGQRLTSLGRNVRMPLQAAALPELTAMAEHLGMTAFLVVRMHDEAVTIESIEPRTTSTHVAYRPGSRHSIERGAPGLALLAGEPPVAGERPEVTVSRARGWASTSGEVTPGLASVSSWIAAGDGSVIAAVACVFLAGMEVDLEQIAARVVAGANSISRIIAGS
ncbi:MAG: Transcriptional regulator, IclR family [Ilumatobacteraceae bacterium]|nr:Transcriptional regulator, IclR family [Ilumatobacteraceae bacterium]